MATQLQIRRGTTAQMNAFTGAEGELAVNTTTDTVHVHDGATAGGFALAKADGSNIGTYAGSFTTISASGAITGNVTGNLTGSVLTAAQTNITSVGTLSTLAVTGEITANGGIALGDSDRATFGASDDLQIYHDGSNSRIVDAGTGIMTIQASSQLGIYNADATQVSAEFVNDGKVGLRFSGSEKLATTSTGIDVTGAATMGGLVTQATANTYTAGAAQIKSLAGDISYLTNVGGSFLISNSSTTDQFTLSSAGLVGISTSSPSTKLHLGGTAPLDSIIRQDSTVSGTNWEIGERAAGKWQIWEDDSDSVVATFMSSGNVGIGSSSPSRVLEVASGTAAIVRITATDTTPGYAVNEYLNGAGGYAYVGSEGSYGGQLFIGSTAYATLVGNTSAVPLQFATNNNVRATIDASGNLLVGKTVTSVSTVGVLIQPSGNIVASPSTVDTYGLYASGNYKFYVGVNGTVYAVNTTISGISDVRYKENIRDLDDGLSKVMQLQPRKFDWKEGKGKDIANDRGFIAQEFEEVFPDLVSEWKDPAPEGEEPYKAVSQDLIPTLVKAIQEQQATIEALTQRIQTLENNQ